MEGNRSGGRGIGGLGQIGEAQQNAETSAEADAGRYDNDAARYQEAFTPLGRQAAPYSLARAPRPSRPPSLTQEDAVAAQARRGRPDASPDPASRAAATSMFST